MDNSSENIFDACLFDLKSKGMIKFDKNKFANKEMIFVTIEDEGINALSNGLFEEPTRIKKILTHINEFNNLYSLFISIAALLLSLLAIIVSLN